MYTYKLSATNSSSAKLGNCEVCNKQVSDVYLQTKYKNFVYEDQERQSHVSDTFGHENCLKGIQL